MKEPVENRGGEGAAALPSLAHTEGDGGVEAAEGCGGLEVEHSPASMAQGGWRQARSGVCARQRRGEEWAPFLLLWEFGDSRFCSRAVGPDGDVVVPTHFQEGPVSE